MKFDTKIAIVLREDLPTWQKLNMTAFLVSGIAGTVEGIIGENYEDASGNSYYPMIIQPMLIFSASAEQIRAAYQRAMERDVRLAVFTEELFSTGDDEENRAAVKAALSDQLRLTGIAMRADKKIVDKVIKGLSLHG